MAFESRAMKIKEKPISSDKRSKHTQSQQSKSISDRFLTLQRTVGNQAVQRMIDAQNLQGASSDQAVQMKLDYVGAQRMFGRRILKDEDTYYLLDGGELPVKEDSKVLVRKFNKPVVEEDLIKPQKEIQNEYKLEESYYYTADEQYIPLLDFEKLSGEEIMSYQEELVKDQDSTQVGLRNKKVEAFGKLVEKHAKPVEKPSKQNLIETAVDLCTSTVAKQAFKDACHRTGILSMYMYALKNNFHITAQPEMVYAIISGGVVDYGGEKVFDDYAKTKAKLVGYLKDKLQFIDTEIVVEEKNAEIMGLVKSLPETITEISRPRDISEKKDSEEWNRINEQRRYVNLGGSLKNPDD